MGHHHRGDKSDYFKPKILIQIFHHSNRLIRKIRRPVTMVIIWTRPLDNTGTSHHAMDAGRATYKTHTHALAVTSTYARIVSTILTVTWGHSVRKSEGTWPANSQRHNTRHVIKDITSHSVTKAEDTTQCATAVEDRTFNIHGHVSNAIMTSVWHALTQELEDTPKI